nr:hypothetical protein CFP56_74240 [Quercus suber]
MSAHGPIISDPVQRLVSHKDYAIKMVNSIIKDTDLDECGQHTTKDLGAFGLFDLAREAARILNVEPTAKVALLKQETRHREELAKVNTNLMMELAALRE